MLGTATELIVSQTRGLGGRKEHRGEQEEEEEEEEWRELEERSRTHAKEEQEEDDEWRDLEGRSRMRRPRPN